MDSCRWTEESSGSPPEALRLMPSKQIPSDWTTLARINRSVLRGAPGPRPSLLWVEN